MSPEDLMRDSDALMVAMHAANVVQIHDTTSLRTEAEQTKLLGSVGLTARRMHEVLALKRRTQARIAADALAIKASMMKAQVAERAAHKAANENEAAQEEQEMDDDSGRTPEGVAALHAEIQRRLAALAARREGKSLARGHVVVGDSARDGDPGAGSGGSSAPAG
jgi:type VI protein secretion system component VasK